MATKNKDGTFIISAGEISVFSVCPQSWHLKWNTRDVRGPASSDSALGQQLHKDWSLFFEESLRLGKWVRVLVVLVYLMVVVFILINSTRRSKHDLFDLSLTNPGLQLVALSLSGLYLIRLFRKEAKRRHTGSGFDITQITVSMDGSALLPEREYISNKQGLAGKPDALIREAGHIIPIERKPLAKKLRDRYVVQLLVYMRLVEEFEGTRPPFGYLLLGPSCRRLRIENSESKQKWVDGMIREMNRILRGSEPTPAPHPIKCAKCDVRDRCHARGDKVAHRR